MSRYADITELIAEQAADRAERLALEATARRLARGLERPVPYRPEFREALRRDLLLAARKQQRSWYRRPAFMGSGIAVAAAVAALALGLSLWQPPAGIQQPGTGLVAEPQPAPPAGDPASTGVQPSENGPPTSYLVSLPADLPAVTLADERGAAVTAALEAPVASAPAGGLQLMRLTARPGEAEFRAMAGRLGFRGESRRTEQGWAISEGERTLTMTTDGTVQYADASPVQAAGPRVEAQAAGQAARRFLDQALLPVYSQPDITAGADGYTVVYTERVEGRPVVNARTEIGVNFSGTVVRAKAYVASGVTTHATYTDYISEREALALAEERGGSFQRADLVWVRSVGEETVYLQPVWRLFGTDAEGAPVARYVPALKR
ncbi:hypothetical protein [Symbiobacterium terraclitae]|uniref:hypothetical protein n=1 Tax=Symbiobacterium terraclitae TaxID=557451 RepID=UPI0035B55724